MMMSVLIGFLATLMTSGTWAQCPGGCCSGGSCYQGYSWGGWRPGAYGWWYREPPVTTSQTPAPLTPAEEKELESAPVPDACSGGICPPRLGDQPEVNDDQREEQLTAEARGEYRPPRLGARVIEIINRHRAALGLPPLKADESLCDGCARHSTWMASGGGFRHGYSGARECIAYGVQSPEAVVNMWLGSSGHRAIILGGGQFIGAGCSGVFWTVRVR